MMVFLRPRSPSIAVALICVCATVCTFLVTLKTVFLARGDQNVTEQLIAKYESLRSLLPPGAPVRFVVDQAHTDLEQMGDAGRLYLAQYAASPLWQASGTESQWAIVDSDSPEIAPEIAKENRWTLAADFGNGLRLYRTHRDYQ